MNLSLVLDMACSGFPDRVAITVDGAHLTYSELDRASRCLSTVIAREDRRAVLYLAANSAAMPVALFAAAHAGVPFVPLNYRMSAEQLDMLVSEHPGALLVHDADVPTTLSGRAIHCDEIANYTGDPDQALEPPADGDAIAVLLYTSGTTAAPKAAVLRHRNLIAYLFGAVEFGAAAPDEAALVAVPPYHVAGVANLLSNLYAGRRIVYLDSFDAQEWIATVRAECVSQAMLVPTMLARVVDELGDLPAQTPSLRSIAYGGARMPLPVLQRALRLFPDTGFVNAYGLTETSSTIALLGPEDHRTAMDAADSSVRARLGSVGKLLPGIELEIRTEDGVPLPPGEPGLLFLRGEQVSGEYVGSSALDADGWFSTRDRGWIDADGYLYIDGRADETIIRGGENIAPAEIEDVLIEHPTVAEAVVVGIPDDEWGQRIVAFVVPVAQESPDATELQAWVRNRLRSSRTPDVILFRDELPRTSTGKLLRRSLVQQLVP
jgi:acyl-CoA synthetase (AMP-forming)/AMP-acid ligase II